MLWKCVATARGVQEDQRHFMIRMDAQEANIVASTMDARERRKLQNRVAQRNFRE